MNKNSQTIFNENLSYILEREKDKKLEDLLSAYDLNFEDDETILESLNELTNEANYCIYNIVCDNLNNWYNTNDFPTWWELWYNRALLDFRLIRLKTKTI